MRTSSRLRRTRAFLRRSCWPVLPVAAAVLAFGTLVQWSVAGGDALPTSHLLRIVVGAAAGAVALLFGARRWRAQAWTFYAGCLGLVLLVLVVGRETNQARRWIDLAAGFKIQPSEFMKLALVLALARWFADRAPPRRLRDLAVPALLTAVPAFLILVEPDLGTSLVFAPLLLGMIWLAGTPWRVMRWLLLVPSLLAPLGWGVIQDYQKERILTWWNQDSLTPAQRAAEGYHLWHAKLAVGSGGLQGFGWARGPENRLGLLPERHNDFIFPVIGEEFGFLGGSLFLLGYAALGLVLLTAAARRRDPFQRLVLAGIGLHFLLHLVLNVGVSIGLWPTTGLPLPMVSFGGSSMIVGGMALGVALAVSATRGPVFHAEAFRA